MIGYVESYAAAHCSHQRGKDLDRLLLASFLRCANVFVENRRTVS